MTIGDSVDGSGSGLLNAISPDLLGKNEGNKDEGVYHVTPSKSITNSSFLS